MKPAQIIKTIEIDASCVILYPGEFIQVHVKRKDGRTIRFEIAASIGEGTPILSGDIAATFTPWPSEKP